MHTQHVKFSTYVAWGSGVGGVVAVRVDFEEGEVSGLLEDDDRSSVFEVVVVVVSFLPSPFVFWVLLDINLNVLIVLCGVVNLEMFIKLLIAIGWQMQKQIGGTCCGSKRTRTQTRKRTVRTRHTATRHGHVSFKHSHGAEPFLPGLLLLLAFHLISLNFYFLQVP